MGIHAIMRKVQLWKFAAILEGIWQPPVSDAINRSCS